MNYNRLVIDTIKQSFSDYVSSGEVDQNLISAAQNSLTLEYDRRKVAGEPTQEIEALKNDLDYIKYDLFNE